VISARRIAAGGTAVGRLGVSMYGLSVILSGVGGYGDYVRAGIIGGTFAASEAVGGPLVGRLVDRRGQHATLPLLAAVHVVAMAGLIAALSLGAEVAVAVPAAVLAGLSVPQLGAFAAARWSHLLRGDRRMDAALSLESLANDVAFIAGPLTASTAVAVLPGAAGLAVAGALAGSATVLLALQRRTIPPVAAPAAAAVRGVPAARRIRALVLTLGLVNVLLGLLFGTTQLAVTALARADGAVALAGAYYLTMSVGSLLASAAYGLITWRTPAWRRLAGAGALIAAGGVAMTLLGHPAAVVAALFVVGLGVGPVIILTGTLIERHVGAALLTQSFALMGALSAAGIALSGLVGGTTVEAHGHAGGFLLIVGYGVALCLVGLAVRGLVADIARGDPGGGPDHPWGWLCCLRSGRSSAG
jgi:MFS family permease